MKKPTKPKKPSTFIREVVVVDLQLLRDASDKLMFRDIDPNEIEGIEPVYVLSAFEVALVSNILNQPGMENVFLKAEECGLHLSGNAPATDVQEQKERVAARMAEYEEAVGKYETEMERWRNRTHTVSPQFPLTACITAMNVLDPSLHLSGCITKQQVEAKLLARNVLSDSPLFALLEKVP